MCVSPLLAYRVTCRMLAGPSRSIQAERHCKGGYLDYPTTMATRTAPPGWWRGRLAGKKCWLLGLDRDQAAGSVDGDRLPGRDRAGGAEGTDHRRDAVLAGDDRAVAERTSGLGDDRCGSAEQGRPGRHGRDRDQDLAGLQGLGLIEALDDAGHATGRAAGARIALELVRVIGLLGRTTEESRHGPLDRVVARRRSCRSRSDERTRRLPRGIDQLQHSLWHDPAG